MRDSLSLLPEDTAAIEAEVLKPYQECKRKLLQYEQVLLEAIERENLLSEETRNDLQYLQQALGLREEDIAAIEGRVLAPKQSVSSPANTIESKESKAAIISPTQDSTSARSQEKTLVESQAKSPTSNPISNSVPIISNKKLVIGAGAIASFVLIFSFLNKPQDIPVTSNSSASPTPIVSSSTPSTSTITAKEIYDRGVDKSNQGDYKGAIEDFNQVLQLDPNFTLAYYQRGNARNEIEDYKKAIEDFSHYIRFNPNDVDAFDNRCIAYNKLNNYNLAISDCNQAIKINSKYSSAYVNRGNGYHGQGNYERAIADYNKSIEINPKSATAYYNRGNTRRRLRNYEEAIKDYNQAIYINPNYADAYFNKGLTHSILRGKQKAIADYQKAAELYQKQRDTKNYQKSLDRIKKLQQ
ncbi:tetratricopeptide repeat protein [Chlorogloeopsis fritschii]|uniref:tetratricopeptide repeat protein n=1 Tax=Chlorogloeopsis fritschii TaxID=1124 RepID=UPI0023F36E16|nr:tetratricopeptide repeat protein [Chlorogloeopsis fritschii]